MAEPRVKTRGDTGARCVCMLGIAILIIALPITLIFTLRKKGHTAPPNAPVPVPVAVVDNPTKPDIENDCKLTVDQCKNNYYTIDKRTCICKCSIVCTAPLLRDESSCTCYQKQNPNTDTGLEVPKLITHAIINTNLCSTLLVGAILVVLQ